MALFGKKKEEKKAETSCCCCGGEQTASEITSTCCGESVDGICCIKVLGSGCKACHQLYDNTVQCQCLRSLSMRSSFHPVKLLSLRRY